MPWLREMPSAIAMFALGTIESRTMPSLEVSLSPLAAQAQEQDPYRLCFRSEGEASILTPSLQPLPSFSPLTLEFSLKRSLRVFLNVARS